MVIKLRSILFSAFFKWLLIVGIFACSTLFLYHAVYFIEEEPFATAESFEDTSAFASHYFQILSDVSARLSDNRHLIGFNADKLEKDLALVQEAYPGFKYRLQTPSGEGISNSIPLETVVLESTAIFEPGVSTHWPERYRKFARGYYDYGIADTVIQIKKVLPEKWVLYLSVDPSMDKGILGEGYRAFVSAKQNLPLRMQAMIGSMVVAVASYLWLLYAAGIRYTRTSQLLEIQSSGEDGVPVRAEGVNYIMQPVRVNWMDRIPLEALLLALPIAILFSGNFYDIWQGHPIEIILLLNSLLALFLIVTLSCVRRIKAKCFLKSAWSISSLLFIYNLLRPSSLQRIFRPILLVYLVLFATANLLIGIVLPSLGPLGLLIWIGLIGVVLYLCIKDLRSYYHLKDYVHQQVSGNLSTAIDPLLITPMHHDFAKDLAALHQGLDIAVADALKNERMRTELITNVTHDLKTPLTSIISYVDLLKGEALNNPTAVGYIEVLQDKSQRLKTLIDHLVEASKLSSGVVQADLKSVDLLAFLQQLEGEFADVFAGRQLQWRSVLSQRSTVSVLPQQLKDSVTSQQLKDSVTSQNYLESGTQAFLVLADDRMLLRILDNLLTNIVKYALPGTRVFLELYEGPDTITLTLKNISEHPLTITAEELAERFVRADSSRGSEGNGLGLSIAQSLAGAIGGQLTLAIDGDMFKATLMLRRAPQ